MESWSSHLAFILAAIGAAVGLGNIWRFSAVLGQNGGGAYLIPYFIAVFVFALPLMVLEIAAGRRFRGTVVSTFAAIRPSFGTIGWLVCIVSFLITAYYLVITGWTFAYLTFSVTGAEVSFDAFTGSYTPVLFALACALITGTIVAAGVRAGIERMVVVLVPLSIGILVIMALYCTTLPGFSAETPFSWAMWADRTFSPEWLRASRHASTTACENSWSFRTIARSTPHMAPVRSADGQWHPSTRAPSGMKRGSTPPCLSAMRRVSRSPSRRECPPPPITSPGAAR